MNPLCWNPGSFLSDSRALKQENWRSTPIPDVSTESRLVPLRRLNVTLNFEATSMEPNWRQASNWTMIHYS